MHEINDLRPDVSLEWRASGPRTFRICLAEAILAAAVRLAAWIGGGELDRHHESE